MFFPLLALSVWLKSNRRAKEDTHSHQLADEIPSFSFLRWSQSNNKTSELHISRDTLSRQREQDLHPFLLSIPHILNAGPCTRWCRAHRSHYSPHYVRQTPHRRFYVISFFLIRTCATTDSCKSGLRPAASRRRIKAVERGDQSHAGPPVLFVIHSPPRD